VGDHLEGDASTLWLSLSVADTRQLLAAAVPEFRLQHLLLAALVRALCWWTEREAILIDVESHGREDFGGKLALARSIGWFTSLYPVRLASPRGEPFAATLRRSADAMTAVPRHGIGYGLMHPAQADDLPPRLVCFNYLGRFQDNRQQGFAWQPSPTAVGPARDPGTPIGYHLKLGGRLLCDQLHLDWVFARQRYAAGTIRAVAQRHMAELRTFLVERGGRRAADWRGSVPRLSGSSSSGLPLAIPPPRRAAPARRSSPRVLLTGATGFLGIHLLQALLRQTAAHVCCLLRADGSGRAGERLAETWRWYFPEVGLAPFAARLEALPGDLRRPRLGMSAGDYEAVRDQVDVIFHCGADVRLIASAQELAAANVSGTEQVLELAQTGRRKVIHHVSTLSVAGRPPHTGHVSFGERHLDIGQEFTSHYARSKFDAERLLRAAATGGARIAIYRFSNLAAHSQTGKFQRDIGSNRIYLSLRAYIESGLAPFLPDEAVGFSYVDRVAAAILALAFDDDTAAGHTYHVENGRTLSLYDLLRVMQAFGYPIAILSSAEYAARVGRSAAGSDGILGLPGIWGHDEPAGGGKLSYDCAATAARLTALGVDFPPPSSSWLRQVVQHCIDVGFLRPPHHWGQVCAPPEILAPSCQGDGEAAAPAILGAGRRQPATPPG